MMRSRGGMCSTTWRLLVVAAVCSSFHAATAGPLPSNVTSSDLGLQPGSCAVGDVVYLAGDELPGSDPCERCACGAGGVQCARQQCEPRPGCKAVHRPDHCCPTYQCECEQEGRVYGNGEKLVDPADPCRVCYCQGGEVVCRRIACFVRDDCRPRLVPGRCCPEYDNCPLRGVTTVPGMAPTTLGNVAIEDVGTTSAPAAPEKVKQEITIKEITPVSEIPVLTDVKIKEILPSPSIEVVEYPSSSKSPLIPREATTEKSFSSEVAVEPEPVSVFDNSVSQSSVFTSTTTAQETNDKVTSGFTEVKSTEDTYPSKISLSTDAINSEIYPSNIPAVISTSSTSPSPLPSTSKAPTEDDDLTPPEHNPAFPPLPDDLSQLSNHEDEISPEPNMDNDHNEHVLRIHEVVSSAVPSTETSTTKDATTTNMPITSTTTTTPAPTTTTTTLTTTPASTIMLPTSDDIKPTFDVSSSRSDGTVSAEPLATKANPMLNLRSAIPTEILSVPSSVPEVITGDLDEEEPSTHTVQDVTTAVVSSTTTQLPVKIVEVVSTQNTVSPVVLVEKDLPRTTRAPAAKITTDKVVTETSQTVPDQTTSYIPKSNIATEVTSQTELSSFPVETSDQNPPRTSDNTEKEASESTSEPLTAPTSMKIVPIEAEPITVSRSASTEKQAIIDNLETTEFLLTSFGSSESATEPVELIQITNTPDKSAAIIESKKENKNNILNDLIDLVGDVASMSDHTEEPGTAKQVTGATSISESEELILVNAGYKSKNNNINLNSITEVPLKSKNPTAPNKSKIVEIEDDGEGITDPPAPNDKSEPTTRRPIIDNVSDDVQKNETSKKDIEIITKSYVPTISRRPTKVVMKKNSDRALAEETSSDAVQVTASSETATDGASSEMTTSAADVTSGDVIDRIEQTSPGAGAGAQ